MDSRVEVRPGRYIHVVTYPHHSSDTSVFLIHGLGGNANQWREQINLLKNQYTLVIPDLLGHGKSDKPNSNPNLYSFPELDQDIQAIFNRYSSSNNIIIGHSYGGALATSLTLDHQDKISKLILIAPLPCTPNTTIPFMYRLPTFLMEMLRPFMEKRFQQLAFAPNADPRLIATEMKSNKANYMRVIKSMVQGMQSMPNIDLTMLHTSSLVIIGELDRVVSPDAQKEFYTHLPHHEIIIIPNASHMVMLEKPQDVNQTLMQFLTATQ